LILFTYSNCQQEYEAASVQPGPTSKGYVTLDAFQNRITQLNGGLALPEFRYFKESTSMWTLPFSGEHIRIPQNWLIFIAPSKFNKIIANEIMNQITSNHPLTPHSEANTESAKDSPVSGSQSSPSKRKNVSNEYDDTESIGSFNSLEELSLQSSPSKKIRSSSNEK
jgi:hypothetical protein